MRTAAIAIIFSLLLSSCSSNRPEAGDSDVMGAAVIAVILGVGVAAMAH